MTHQIINPKQFVLPPKLESGQLIVRPYANRDKSTMHRILRENIEHLREDFPNLVALVAGTDEATLFREYERLWGSREALHLGVWENRTLQYVGEISLRSIDWTIPKADVCYFVVRGWEGKRIATEALLLSLPFSFEELHMMKLQLRCAVTNLASQRVAEHCGFKIEGVLRNDSRSPLSNTLRSVVYYGMTAADYRSLRLKP